MPECESTGRDDCEKLREIFVSVTGETDITDRQDRETVKKVIDITRSPSREQRPDTGPRATGLTDAIGDP